MTVDSGTYEACPTRRRRTKAEIARIRQAIHDVVAEDPPMTVRQVFYQLVVAGAIEKTEAAYQGTVIRLLTDMRLDGGIPYKWIIDESRRRRVTRTYDSVADAMEQTARFYRRSALQQANDYIEIWCEKDALAGLMWQATSLYDVPLMVSRGMPSLTFLHDTAQEIWKASEAGKSTFIYQFGDHDPSGVLIPQTIERRLDEMCEQLGCEPPLIERVALTAEMIATHNLPTRPTKREGNRHAAGFAGNSVELDALPPRVLRALVQEVIDGHISEHELKVLRTAEESEREQLRMFARGAVSLPSREEAREDPHGSA
jgi:hypothetical protein